MPDGAIIIDRAFFDKPEWLHQARNGGFSRGTAWLDLIAITNAAPTETEIRGIRIPLERGQCAYSKLGLAKRWGRSQSWVATTLEAWKNDGRIAYESSNETTLITLVNYEAWQDGMMGLLNGQREQNASKPRTEREQTETEKGEGRGTSTVPRGEERRERELTHAPEINIPSIEETRMWAERSGIDPEYAELKWRTTTGNDAWQARSGRMIDWQNLWLGFWNQDRTKWVIQKKNSAPGARQANRLPTDAAAWWELGIEALERMAAGMGLREDARHPRLVEIIGLRRGH